MRKVGKYEKMRKNALLSSYITSVLCLVLCVTMFFGTTAAWFTDTTTSEKNQIHVGTLAVTLEHASFVSKTVSQYEVVPEIVPVDGNPVLDSTINWEPGYTAVKKFKLTENGDLAFSYQLGIEHADLEAAGAEKIEIAKAITVWNYTGDNAEGIVNLPANFDEMVAAEWEAVGTLYDVITNHKPVFKGEMDKDKATAVEKNADGTAILENGKPIPEPAEAYHIIALHMDERFDGFVKDASGAPTVNTVMGETLDNLTIKLVATQLPSEEDAFDSYYDATTYETVVVSDVSNAAGAFDMNKDTAVYLPAGETNVPAIALHGTGESESDYLLIGKNTTFANSVTISSHPNLKLSDDAVLTIDGITVNGTLKVASYHKNIVIKNVKAKTIEVDDHGNVTIENCQIDGSAGNGIYLVGAANGYNMTIRNNTIKNAGKNAIQISGCATGATYGAGEIIVEGNSFDTWCQLNDEPRAAFKIWGDAVYAPEDITASKAINDAAKELISSIGANNTFNATNMNRVKFDIYGYTFDALN